MIQGFHDRNEAHPFQTVDRFPAKGHTGRADSQGSMSSKSGDHADHADSRTRLHTPHKDSPNQQSSVSPGSRQSNDRSSPRLYRNKESYLQRQREKQKALGDSPEENMVNHHHGTNSHVTDHEKHIKAILAKAGEWSEHTSSSGKKYYYNCRTEVSQWEKPKEWLEREKLQRALGTKDRPVAKESPRQGQAGDGTPSKSDTNNKHSSDSAREKPTPSPLLHQQQTNRYPERHCGKPQERSSSKPHDRPGSTSTTSALSRGYSTGSYSVSHKRPAAQSSSQTPYASLARSQSELPRTERDRRHDSDYQQREHSHINDKSRSSSGTSLAHSSGGSSSSGGLSLATDIYGRLKPLVSHSRSDRDRTEPPRVRTTPSPGTPTAATPSPLHSKPHHNHQPSQQGLHPPAAHKLFPAHSPSLDRHGHPHHHTDRVDDAFERLSNQSPISVASVSDLSSPAISQPSPRNQTSTSTPHVSHTQSQSSQSKCNSQSQSRSNLQGQPQSESRSATPTSSQPSSIFKPGQGLANSKRDKPPVLDIEDHSSPKEGHPAADSKEPSPVSTSPTPSQTSSQSGTGVSSLPTTPQKPVVATITPSLALYYNESLTKHVSGWSSEPLDRQAQRLFEDSHTLGAELCAKVSADLKFARSLVRVSEIQATLQEQRILFLRQQAKDLEKLRNENAYMT